MKEFIIGVNDAGQRFDKYLFKLLKNAGTGLIFKQPRNKNIVLNNKKSKGSEVLCENDVVKIFMADDTIEKFMGKPVCEEPLVMEGFKIVYEDENVLLADKPVGILSQKSKPSDISMNEYIINHWKKTHKTKEATFKPAFCNRLDRNTSGLMVGGMSLRGLQKMSEIIKDRSLQKYYLAIVKGRVDKKETLNGYLFKDEATNQVVVKDKEFTEATPIYTEYEPLLVKDELSLIMVHLITGKTHQIRAHLAHIGHPILGDVKYGDIKLNKKYNEKMQLLHSYKVVFPKLSEEFINISGKSFCTEYPEGFKKYFTYDEFFKTGG